MPARQLDTQPQAAPPTPAARYPRLKRLVLRAVIVAAFLYGVVVLLSHAGSFLTLNNPKHSDVMVVLEGADSSRYAHAIDLYHQGYSPLILLDADATHDIYGKTEADLVTDYIARTHQGVTQVCPTLGDSTFAEAVDVQHCMQHAGATSAIIVTSNFHTRRALSIFQKRLPQYQWTVAAASAPYHFADEYWKHRAWAKSVLDEWEKFLWWKLVDQWRSDVVLPATAK